MMTNKEDNTVNATKKQLKVRRRFEVARRGYDRTIYPRVIDKYQNEILKTLREIASVPVKMHAVEDGLQDFIIDPTFVSLVPGYDYWHEVHTLSVTLLLRSRDSARKLRRSQPHELRLKFFWKEPGMLFNRRPQLCTCTDVAHDWFFVSKPTEKRLTEIRSAVVAAIGI